MSWKRSRSLKSDRVKFSGCRRSTGRRISAARVGLCGLGFVALIQPVFAQPLSPPKLVEVGQGWSKNSVNAVIFRRNSVVTHESTQFTAYYRPNGRVTLAKRMLGSDQWEVRETRLIGDTGDAHNSISLMVDGAGYLHLAWNHHGDPLQYARSLSPGSLELRDGLSMIGRTESRVTYPEFHRFPDGDLLFLYRDGQSGRGNLVMNRYETASQKWYRVQDVLLDGEGKRNAYWQAVIDHSGTIHLSWVWRETADVATNHDLCYARSSDRGATWEKTTGEVYEIPINASNAEYARRIPEESELINQTSMAIGPMGQPVIASYWRPNGSDVPQYHLVYNQGGQWITRQISSRKTPFSLSGRGTKRIPISRPQVVVGSARGDSGVHLV
ncbi:MAG: BNR repeat-containing protein, partial [Acidobacteriota bacterium]